MKMSWPLLLLPTNPGPDLRLAGRKGRKLGRPCAASRFGPRNTTRTGLSRAAGTGPSVMCARVTEQCNGRAGSD